MDVRLRPLFLYSHYVSRHELAQNWSGTMRPETSQTMGIERTNHLNSRVSVNTCFAIIGVRRYLQLRYKVGVTFHICLRTQLKA